MFVYSVFGVPRYVASWHSVFSDTVVLCVVVWLGGGTGGRTGQAQRPVHTGQARHRRGKAEAAGPQPAGSGERASHCGREQEERKSVPS